MALGDVLAADYPAWWIEPGHVTDGLAKLPDGCVSVCVTSPPYYGLRAYGTDPRVWGGDPECGHEWGEMLRLDRRHIWKAGSAGLQENQRASGAHERLNGSFCARCPAWRGELGSEPTPDLFVEHLVEVFREVRRVLHPTGLLFVNLGDSYVGSGKGPTGHNGIGDQPTGQGFANGRGATSQLGLSTRDAQERTGAVPGLAPLNLIGVPWRFAFAMQADGWVWRQTIYWVKKCLSGGTMLYARTQKGDMPQTVKDLARLDPKTVKLWNGRCWTRVVGWYENPDPSDPLEIELRSGERIGCTPDHRFPTKRGLLQASELRVGDVLEISRLPEPDEAKRPSALNDAEIGWFVGIYLAEGCRSAHSISIAAHAKETTRHERLKLIAESLHGSATWRIAHGHAATTTIYGRLPRAILDTYIAGTNAKTKRLTNACWERSDVFLRALLDGYLEGDGHWDAENRRWRLGFTRNYALEANLRTICARLGISLRLRPGWGGLNGKKVPIHRGEIRFERSDHHRNRPDGEIVRIGFSRGRKFWDIEIEDEPHTFALGSGVLTHNSSMPESVRGWAWERCRVRTDANEHEARLRARMAERGTNRNSLGVNAEKLAAERAGMWADCPGCPKCRDNDGYVLRRGSGRPTCAVEVILMFSRQDSRDGYYYDDVAVRTKGVVRPEQVAARWGGRINGTDKGQPEGIYHDKPHYARPFANTDPSGANARNVLILGPEPLGEGHYAAFPTAVPDFCIKAGSSERGVCPECGMPWARVVERENQTRLDAGGKLASLVVTGDRKDGNLRMGDPSSRTLGWRPTCRHRDRAPIPSLVLDPFSGSGRAGIATLRLGRRYIGLELNPQYVEMSRRLIRNDAPLWNGT